MLLDERGYVKLADFGFAKRLGRDSRTRTFCGTPGKLNQKQKSKSQGKIAVELQKKLTKLIFTSSDNFVIKLKFSIFFLGYLAPELLLKRPHGFPADFWSIGVFLFELLSCKSPFRRHDVSIIIKIFLTTRGKLVVNKDGEKLALLSIFEV